MNNNKLISAIAEYKDAFIRTCTADILFKRSMYTINSHIKTLQEFLNSDIIEWDNLTEENLLTLGFQKFNISFNESNPEYIWLIPVYLYYAVGNLNNTINNKPIISIMGDELNPNDSMDTTIRYGCLAYGVHEKNVISSDT